MLKLVVVLTVRPEYVDKIQVAAKDLVEKSRAEAGNIEYSLVKAVNCDNKFMFIETWQDQAALDYHTKQPHFIAAGDLFGKMVEKTELYQY